MTVEAEDETKDTKEDVADTVEDTEATEDKAPQDEVKEKSEVKEYNNDEEGTSDNNSEESTEDSNDAKRATVYADDFDAVRVEKRFSMSRLFLFILIIIISAGIFFTGMMLYQSNNGNLSMPQFAFLSQPTPTPTEAPSPTPSPTPEITNSDYTVQVLNGSGVSGQAGAVAGLLEDEGFEDVEVGNAENQDYEDTEVQMQEDVPEEVFDEIAKILSDYTVVEGDELDSDEDFEIVITVGQENGEEPTPTDSEEEE